MGLKSKVHTLLANALTQCSACDEADVLAAELEKILARIEEPLRVAVVGIMKAGKSTLMNALLKENLLFTGKVETTYTVTWFKYAEKASLTVFFRDGSTRNAPVEELEKWTTRQSEGNNALIDDVDYVVIHYPNEILKTIELIDTPGLNSSHKKDSRNTERVIAGKSFHESERLNEQAEADTRKNMSAADAVLYAYYRSMGEVDADFLKQFSGSTSYMKTSPINALGVYTQSDRIWNFEDETAIQAAESVTKVNLEHPVIRKLVYTILPTVGKLAEGIAALTDEDWQVIKDLSNINTSLLSDFLTFSEEFAKKERNQYPENVKPHIGSTEQRSRLIFILGQYGIYEVVKCIQSGLSREETILRCYEISGINSVFEMLRNHFGNRAFLIKVNGIFNYLTGFLNVELQKNPAKIYENICNEILSSIDMIKSEEQCFKELRILQEYYNGRSGISSENEIEDLMRITGEYGKVCEAKLGVEKASTTEELKLIAKGKAEYWNARAAAFVVSPQYRMAATTIADSYSQIYFHLKEINEI